MEDLEDLINQYSGIQPAHIAFYSQAIRFNVEASVDAIHILSDFSEMTKQSEGEYEDSAELQTTVLDAIQNMLTHAAEISNFFWPAQKGLYKLHKKRGQALRKLFRISDSSVLKDKSLRNHIAHLDENLDNYLWNKPIVGNVIPAYVGGEIDREGVPYHFFRAFFVDTGVFESLGTRFELQPIVDELCELYRTMSPHDHT